MRLVTAEEMRAIDRRAIEDLGIPGATLMENAGREVAQRALALLRGARLSSPQANVSSPRRKSPRPPWAGGRFAQPGPSVLILCGRGNNGGDGFVAARHLHNAGIAVRCLALGTLETLKGDALLYGRIARDMGLDMIELGESPNLARVEAELKKTDLVIDALLGTGTSGEIREPFSGLIEAINAAAKPVLSVDLPSGLNSDTGQPLGPCVRARATVTLCLAKVGLAVYPGLSFAGEVTVGDIGVPRDWLEGEDQPITLVEGDLVARKLPKRPPDAHKGLAGRVLILAGSVGLTGAAVMAADAAGRTGAGLIYVGIPESLNPIFEEKLLEAISVPLPEGSSRALGEPSLAAALDVAQGCDAVAVGPGLGRDPGTCRFARRCLAELPGPLVADADALFALAEAREEVAARDVPPILTPHPGEMARLLGCSIAEVQADRLAAAREGARRFSAVLLLKGARTVIADPAGRIFINPTGNPGMASGGMGDVLTGIIVALLGQRVEPLWAAICGAYLHGLAGDLAAQERGPVGILARDLIDLLPRTLVLAAEGYTPPSIFAPLQLIANGQ